MTRIMGSTVADWSEGLGGPTGGILWHARALRSRGRWEHFNTALRAWLNSWNVASDSLILVGPSAGWTLPGDFLARFGRIHCIDIDPLARPLFQLRHGAVLREARVCVTWGRSDFMREAGVVLKSRPGAAILLANMLGQHGFRSPSSAIAEKDIERLREHLQLRSWASFHDRLSGAITQSAPLPSSFDHQGPISTEALASRVGRTGLWHDHLTAHALPPLTTRRLMPWRIDPRRVHWVEAGHVN